MNRLRANPRLLAPLLAGLAMLGPFSIDTFFPAFGAMEKQFGILPLAMQQTITVYMAAYAVMSLVHGPLSDAYGRRGVILISLVVYAIAAAGCGAAASFHQLLAFRVLQGMSAGAGLVVGRAIIRDRFDGADAQRLMAQVTLIFGVAPAAAPIIGGWVLYFLNWRWIFRSLSVFTLVLLLLSLLALPETHPRERRSRLAPLTLAYTYRAVAGDARFMWLAFGAAFNFGSLFLYIASAPTVILDMLHLNERQFWCLFVPAIGGMMIGSILSGRLAGKLSAERTVRLGYRLIFGAAVVNLAMCALFKPILPWFMLPMACVGAGVQVAFPTLTLLMLDRFPAARGAAASVQSAVALAVAGTVAGLVSPLVAGTPLSLALSSAASGLLGFLCWTRYRRTAPAVPEVLPDNPVAAGTAVPPREA